MTLPYTDPASYQQWADDLEAYGGLPQTPQETAIISAWEQSENPVNQVGSYTKQGGYNALNTSLTAGSSGLEPGSTFIPVFPTALNAIQATWATLNQSNYAPELAALKHQSGPELISALGAPGSVWGSNPATVSQILGEGASTATSKGGVAAPATTGGTGTTVNLTGFGAILQSLDTVMNPTGGSTLTQILTLAGSDVLASVEGLVVRGLFSAAFIGVLYFGVKALSSSGGGGGGTGLIDSYQSQQRINQGDRRLDIQQQEADRKAGLLAGTTDALETVGEVAAL